MTSYQNAAKKRWPGYSITGDGAFAMVNRSLCFIHLFRTGFEGLAEMNERNDAQFCSVIELQADERGFGIRKSKATADGVERERR